MTVLTTAGAPLFTDCYVEMVELGDVTLTLGYSNGKRLLLENTVNYCCEHRYITCDDDLSNLRGQQVVSIEVTGVEDCQDGRSAEHEVAFVKIQFTRECITLASHNRHSGSYSGFHLQARLLDVNRKEMGAWDLPTK